VLDWDFKRYFESELQQHFVLVACQGGAACGAAAAAAAHLGHPHGELSLSSSSSSSSSLSPPPSPFCPSDTKPPPPSQATEEPYKSRLVAIAQATDTLITYAVPQVHGAGLAIIIQVGVLLGATLKTGVNSKIWRKTVVNMYVADPLALSATRCRQVHGAGLAIMIQV
jgi:hypothetical protein